MCQKMVNMYEPSNIQKLVTFLYVAANSERHNLRKKLNVARNKSIKIYGSTL